MQNIRSIFLVEDDQIDQQFFMDALLCIEDVSLSDVAVNGREAMEKLRGMSALPSIIFIDYDVPVMNGMDFLKEKARYPLIKNVPVVILSSSLDKRDEALRLGAKLFILKPLDGGVLREEVEQAVNTGL